MKKILLVLGCLLIVLFGITAAEETIAVYTCGDYRYMHLEDGTAQITGFTGDSSGKELIIPGGLDGCAVTSIGMWAFYDESFKEIVIPDGVTSIGDYAFGYNSELAVITIPDSVTSIRDGAFSSCSTLKEIVIPDSVMSIGDYAFSSCNSLKEITIPNSVSLIGRGVFPETLTKINVSPDHPVFSIIEGVLIDKKENEIICYLPGFEVKGYSIPDSVTSIGEAAFVKCSSLTKVTIPDTVTSIGDGVFKGCDSLRIITIPDSVTSIGPHTFSGCKSLNEITIPDSVTSIADSAFWYCDSVTFIVDRDSYAEQFAKENGIEIKYSDYLDWLKTEVSQERIPADKVKTPD